MQEYKTKSLGYKRAGGKVVTKGRRLNSEDWVRYDAVVVRQVEEVGSGVGYLSTSATEVDSSLPDSNLTLKQFCRQ